MAIHDLESEIVRLLDWLYDNGAADNYVTLKPYIDDRGLAVNDGYALGENFESRLLGKQLATMGGRVDIKLTPRGTSAIQAIRAERNDYGKRNADLRRQMLVWLYGQEAQGVALGDWSSFIAEGRSHLGGRPFTIDEATKAAEYLHGRNLITATTIDQARDGSLYPHLTPDGEDCVTNFEGDVAKFMNRGSASNIGNVFNITDNSGNVVAGGDNNTQTLNNGLDTSTVLKFAGMVSQILPVLGLSDGEQAEVRQQSDELHAEASTPGSDIGVLRRLIDSIMAGVNRSAGTAAGAVVLELGQEAIRSISGG